MYLFQAVVRQFNVPVVLQYKYTTPRNTDSTREHTYDTVAALTNRHHHEFTAKTSYILPPHRQKVFPKKYSNNNKLETKVITDRAKNNVNKINVNRGNDLGHFEVVLGSGYVKHKEKVERVVDKEASVDDVGGERSSRVLSSDQSPNDVVSE